MGFESQSRRGRPKGSGIDDTAMLAQIAELIAANPDLKPTTAIRALGIEDPSVIRRLRDKLKGSELSAAPALASASYPVPSRTPRTMAAAVANDDDAIRETPRLRVVSETTTDSARSGPVVSSLTPAASLLVPLMAFWLDVGFRAASVALEVQQAAVMHWVRTPVVATVIRQQIAFNELAVAQLLPAFPRASTKS